MTIRAATDADLTEVLRWLKDEHDATDEGFWVNRGVIERHHRDGLLHVWADPATDLAVGFVAGSLSSPDILSVRPDRRRSGIGKALAAFFIEASRQEDAPAIEIECAPSTSIPFWRERGFTTYATKYAYRVIEKRRQLPPGLPPVTVRIGFWPENAQWKENVKPLLEAAPEAVRTPNGRVLLGERVVCFVGRHRVSDSDVVISIEVDGDRLCFEKCKDPEVAALGVSGDRTVWYIDEIRMPPQ